MVIPEVQASNPLPLITTESLAIKRSENNQTQTQTLELFIVFVQLFPHWLNMLPLFFFPDYFIGSDEYPGCLSEAIKISWCRISVSMGGADVSGEPAGLRGGRRGVPIADEVGGLLQQASWYASAGMWSICSRKSHVSGPWCDSVIASVIWKPRSLILLRAYLLRPPYDVGTKNSTYFFPRRYIHNAVEEPPWSYGWEKASVGH